jgi:hypothetical protein
VRSGQAAAARAGGIGFRDFKGKIHTPSLSKQDPEHGCEEQNHRHVKSTDNGE